MAERRKVNWWRSRATDLPLFKLTARYDKCPWTRSCAGGTFVNHSFTRAVLADGSVVMASAAFQDGALIEFADGIATVQNRYLGATSFDRKELRGMILRPQATRHPLDEQHKRILDYEGIETDTVWLLGGDVIAGDLQRVSEERLVIVADSQVLQIPAQRVSMLSISPPAKSRA